MPTRNINLTDHWDRFVEAGVKSGRYGNASEVVREALRLLEERQKAEKAKLEWLRRAANDGLEELDRGEGIEFSTLDDLDSYLQKLGEEASAELAAERKRGQARKR
jgi:antitoxin ParD1/3/4